MSILDHVLRYPRIPRSKRKTHKLTKGQIQEIRDLRLQGMTQKSIAQRFGITRHAVSWHTNEAKRRRSIALHHHAWVGDAKVRARKSALEVIRQRERRRTDGTFRRWSNERSRA